MKIPEKLSRRHRSVHWLLSAVMLGTACFWGPSDTPLRGAGPDVSSVAGTASFPIVHSFEVITPAEFHVPANRQVVRAEFHLRNTSRCPLRLAILCCDQQWRWGLVPSWKVEYPKGAVGPISPGSFQLAPSSLSGNWIWPGMDSCPVKLEFHLNQGSHVGDRETVRLKFSLTDPCTGAAQTADWAVDVVIRESGLPLLISETIPYPSEGK
jgi:hypothetical protein